MESKQPGLKSIGYVILFVRDVPKAAEFYRDKLGIEHGEVNPEWMELKTDGTTLALHRSDEAPPHHVPGTPDVVFNVDDITATHAMLAARGVEIHELHQVWESPEVVGVAAAFHDLDGNRMSLHGTVPRSQWKG